MRAEVHSRSLSYSHSLRYWHSLLNQTQSKLFSQPALHVANQKYQLQIPATSFIIPLPPVSFLTSLPSERYNILSKNTSYQTVRPPRPPSTHVVFLPPPTLVLFHTHFSRGYKSDIINPLQGPKHMVAMDTNSSFLYDLQ